MTLSTHVLDAVRGAPAVDVGVRLERDGAVLAEARTDADGRVREFDVGAFGPLTTGTHRLTFDTGSWFAAAGRPTFYPEVTVTFTVTDPGQHHHVPLLLSPFAYSTYRGS